jgi:hypothetical protein
LLSIFIDLQAFESFDYKPQKVVYLCNDLANAIGWFFAYLEVIFMGFFALLVQGL